MSGLESIANGVHVLATHLTTAGIVGVAGLAVGETVGNALLPSKAQTVVDTIKYAGVAVGLVAGTHLYGSHAHAYLTNPTHAPAILYGAAGAGIAGGIVGAVIGDTGGDGGCGSMFLSAIACGVIGVAGYSLLQAIAR